MCQELSEKPSQIDQIAIDDSLSNQLNKDSLFSLQNESIVSKDSLDRKDSVTVKNEKKGDIETTINYSSVDSIWFNVKEQQMYLFGDAHVDYGTITLDADLIIIDWKKNTLTATYLVDSTGKKTGVPVFKDKEDTYVANKIVFNYKTNKGYISELVTQQGEGYLSGEDAFKDEHDNLLVKNAKYTTCNHAHPHYYFRLRKTKAIPDKKVITNFFNLYIEDVPLPLGLPFGIFPSTDKKTSGMLIPRWGTIESRGFYLSDGGYYWAINDYVSTKVTGEIYTKGGWGANSLTAYKKRYAYDGNVTFRYRNVVRDGDQFDRADTRDYELRWMHMPQSKPGGGRFSSNVNFATSTYNSNNRMDLQNNLTNTLNSSISYSTPIKGTPFNLTSNINHEQNNQTKIVNFTLPDVTLGMARINPFRFGESSGKKTEIRKFYESVGVSYTGSMQNRVSNNTRPSLIPNFDVYGRDLRTEGDTLDLSFANFGQMLQNGRFGVQHSVPVSASMKLGPISVNPAFNYTDQWYTKQYSYSFVEDSNSVRIDTTNGFYRAYDYTTSISMTTRMYGFYKFKGERDRQIRHVLTPTVGMSFSPDIRNNQNIYQNVQINELGKEEYVSRYLGQHYPTPSGARASIIQFNLLNNLEMKAKAKSDTAETFKKTKLIDNFSISTSYNFAAEKFKLAPVNMSFNTMLFNIISINASSTLDPYNYEAVVEDPQEFKPIGNTVATRRIQQDRIDQYAWETGNSIGKISRFNVAMGTNLSPAGFKKKEYKSDKASEEELRYLNMYSEDYVDFNIPWTLSLNYNVSYDAVGFQQPNIIQSMNLRGDVNLTENWKVGFNGAFDFKNMTFISPSLNIYRDMHCWEMTMFWIPFGPIQMYEFNINVKSQMLQDLKLSRRRSIRDKILF